ncbi:MAG: Gfo/Idh/MocA family protein [Bacteroidota bacterium]
MENKSRRSFLKNSAIAMAGAGLYTSIPKDLYASTPPSDRINIGVIGVNWWGTENMQHLLRADSGAQCVALCDVDQVRLKEQAAVLKNEFPERAGSIKFYDDFRKLLGDKDIDGVIIATPDHWHTYMFAEACKAGKAIYVEKPTGHSIAECRIMVDLQRKYKNVVTTGLWQISLGYFIDAFKILETGVLGDVYKVHCWIPTDTDPVIYDPAPQPVPETIDYDMWIGPAPFRPYNSNRFHKKWRYYWDFGGGQQTDWVHYLDSAFDGLLALGHPREYPKSVFSVGYKHPDTMIETPRVQTSVFQFDNYHVVWEQQATNLYNRVDGVAWIGSKGTLVCNRSGYEIIPKKDSDGKPLIEPKKVDGPYGNQHDHMINWANCIRNNNQKTNGTIEKGSYATEVAWLANISHRLGGVSIEYLPEEMKFRNNPEADAYIHPDYQNGWEFPSI